MIQVYNHFEQILTLRAAQKKDGRKLEPKDLDLIKNGSIVFDEEQILWLGQTNDLPEKFKTYPQKDYSGHVLTPGIIDSHTHLVFGGDRSREYSMRLNGASYEDIANEGGGILATMEKTITSSPEELLESAIKRVKEIASYGVKVIEVKSGYGLTMESERKISKVIHKLKIHFKGKIKIFNTFLAAHAVPGGFKSSSEYIDKIVIPLMDELAEEQIIDFVDIFHEKGYFDIEDSKKLFTKCQELNLPVKIHADEFNDNKGAVLATEFNALSADHLLCTTEDGIKALSTSSTVATILPGTAFFLGKNLANARAFLDAGCKVALASDYNPGSCHCDNLLLIASISAKSLGLNIAELWSAITLNAASALGIKDMGYIDTGLKPNFSIFNCSSIDKITYSWGKNFYIES